VLQEICWLCGVEISVVKDHFLCDESRVFHLGGATVFCSGGLRSELWHGPGHQGGEYRVVPKCLKHTFPHAAMSLTSSVNVCTPALLPSVSCKVANVHSCVIVGGSATEKLWAGRKVLKALSGSF
jgi:hypothetical protein